MSASRSNCEVTVFYVRPGNRRGAPRAVPFRGRSRSTLSFRTGSSLRSHIPKYAGSRSCILRCLALEPRCFRGLSCPFGHSKPRIRSTLHLAAARDPLEDHATLLRFPGRVAIPYAITTIARCDLSLATTSGASSTGSRVPVHVAMLRLAQRVLMFRARLAPLARTIPRTCSLRVLRRYRTHSLRAFIFSVLSSRKFGVSVSEIAALLELLRRPTKPPGSQAGQLSPPYPSTRKISPVRLAAHPIQWACLLTAERRSVHLIDRR